MDQRLIYSLIIGIALALIKNITAVDEWKEEEEPNLKEKLNQLRKTNHTGPIKARLRNSLPRKTYIFCEQSHGKLNARNKKCYFENICYDLKENRLKIAKDFEVDGVQTENINVIETTSYREAFIAPFIFNNQYGDFDMNSKKLNHSLPLPATVLNVANPTLLFTRFFASNIMHTFHDDIFPILLTIVNTPELLETEDQHDNLRLIVSIEGNSYGGFDKLYNLLGQYHKIHDIKHEMGVKGTEVQYVCFENAVIGLSSSTTWYHYGYWQPQGPISPMNKTFIGENLKLSVDWIKDRMNKNTKMNIIVNEETAVESKKSKNILIISRTTTRLILNENELMTDIQNAFPDYKVRMISQEMDSIEDLIVIASQSSVLIGMHGALMILAAFMPQNSVVIELFPFGIPSDKYVPYKTLAGLPGFNLRYRSWVNPREEAPFNVGHIARPWTAGGLNHLPKSYQNGIIETKTVPPHICCKSPFWLYRIFQDTQVDTMAIVDLIKEAKNHHI